MADRITKVSRNLQQNNSETITNKNDKEMLKKDIHLQNKTESY